MGLKTWVLVRVSLEFREIMSERGIALLYHSSLSDFPDILLRPIRISFLDIGRPVFKDLAIPFFMIKCEKVRLLGREQGVITFPG